MLEALSLLDARGRQSRAVSGLQRVWAAARTSPVEMPAAEDLGAPDVMDDAVHDGSSTRCCPAAAGSRSSTAARSPTATTLAITLRKMWSPPLER